MKPRFPLQNKKIWVTGHQGMAGTAIVRRLRQDNCQILTASRDALDLRRQNDVEAWTAENKPQVIIHAAAKVGGIKANKDYPAEFLYENLMIEANVIHAAYKTGVEKLLFIGSSCIYPREAPQPIPEAALLTGPLETTNEAYAVAKIAGLKLCQSYRRQYGCDFITVMPCNLYGPGDTYDPENSHVIPALIMKLHEAREKHSSHAQIWGTGAPLREFLYVDDMADALICLLEHYSGSSPVNIGSGSEITISALAAKIADIAGYRGEIIFNPAMPDGTPRKVLDSSRIRGMGWAPRMDLERGLRQAYADYRERFLHVVAA
jgi:GDP-L-fucose synthase